MAKQFKSYMTILGIEFEPSNARGGQERSYFDILTGLHREGHEVILYYVKKGNLVDEYQKMGIKTIQIPILNIFNKTSIREISLFVRSFCLFKNVKNNIIYINQIQDLPLAAIVKRLKGARKLVCHLRLPPLYGHLEKSKNQISLLHKYIDTFIVANINMKEAHINNGVPRDKIFIVPNGFDFVKTFFQKPIDPSNLKICYIGRINEEKGLKELICAMPKVKSRIPNTSLAIAGSPMNFDEQEYLQDCKKLVVKLKLENCIQFVGRKNDPIEFLKNYDLTIFPSTWNEPFGRVLVESIMAGVPVLARDVGSTSEILNDNCKKWLYSNDEILAVKIENLAKGKIEYDVSSILEFQKANYSLDKVINSVSKLLMV